MQSDPGILQRYSPGELEFQTKVPGFVKASGFLVFQAYGQPTHRQLWISEVFTLHSLTQRSSMHEAQSRRYTNLILWFFDRVWRLNLMAIKFKTIRVHTNSLRKDNREVSPDSNLHGYRVFLNFFGFESECISLSAIILHQIHAAHGVNGKTAKRIRYENISDYQRNRKLSSQCKRVLIAA